MAAQTQIKVEGRDTRISQGDIIRDVELIENIKIDGGNLTVQKILFPLIIVLTQDCDLDQDYDSRKGIPARSNQDKHLISVLVAPIYNIEHFYEGDHLSELGLKMTNQNRKDRKTQLIINNEIPRYHYLEFEETISIVPSIIDFKHYFSVNIEYIEEIKDRNYIGKVSELYREQISQRFTSFLGRIGLP